MSLLLTFKIVDGADIDNGNNADKNSVEEVVNRKFKVHVMGLSRLSGDCMCPP